MVLAEQKLKEARGLVLTGYHGDSDLLNKAKNMNLIAKSIYEEMEDKAASSQSSKGTRPRRRGSS